MRNNLVIALALVVSGCGNSSTPPTPIPAAPAAPPLTQVPFELPPPALPPVTSGTLSEALRSDADFRTGSTELAWDIRAATVTSTNRPYDGTNSIRVFYDSAADNYIVSNAIGTRRIDWSGNGTFQTHRTDEPIGTRDLRVLRASPANPKIALTYTSYGLWNFDSSTRPDTDPRIDDWHFFYFGIPTPLSAIPVSGRGHYSGVVEGGLFTKDEKFYLDGTMTLDADFATGAIGTTMQLAAANLFGTRQLVIAPLAGTASISPSTGHFVGTLTTPDNSFEGSVQGTFFGPTAQEVGYSFGINDPAHTKIGGGVAVGKQ